MSHEAALKGIAGCAMMACVVAGAFGLADDTQLLAVWLGAILGTAIMLA